MSAETAVEFILKNAKRFAKAKSERIYLEEYRKSLKAILMKKSEHKVMAAQERDAYADPEYLNLLDGLREAVEIEETIRWQMVAAQAKIELYRTESANARSEVRVTL